jgi:hypothetical protein
MLLSSSEVVNVLDGVRNQFLGQGLVLEQIKQKLRQAVEAGIVPTKEQVLAMAGDLFDKHIAPLDIPGVPNAIEPWFDAIARVLFLRAVGAAYDSIVG